MNKIILIMAVGMLLIPGVVMAQEMPDDIEEAIEINWRLITARRVIWIGESLGVFVNGSANTTFNLELRRFNATDHSLFNASYSAYGRTGENGTAYMEIPDDFTEIPGEYRIQIVINNLAVAFIDIQVNFDPQRYDALQREDIWDFLGYEPNNLPDWTIRDYIDDSVELDKYEVDELNKGRYWDYIITSLLIFIILAQTNVWINRYVEWRTKHGKGSFVVRATSRAGDRTRDYGGARIGGSEPKINNNCLGLTKALDEGQNIEWNLEGKTSSQVMPQIMRNAKAMGVKMPAKAVHEEKPSWFKRKKKVKDND